MKRVRIVAIPKMMQMGGTSIDQWNAMHPDMAVSRPIQDYQQAFTTTPLGRSPIDNYGSAGYSNTPAPLTPEDKANWNAYHSYMARNNPNYGTDVMNHRNESGQKTSASSFATYQYRHLDPKGNPYAGLAGDMSTGTEPLTQDQLNAHWNTAYKPAPQPQWQANNQGIPMASNTSPAPMPMKRASVNKASFYEKGPAMDYSVDAARTAQYGGVQKKRVRITGMPMTGIGTRGPAATPNATMMSMGGSNYVPGGPGGYGNQQQGHGYALDPKRMQKGGKPSRPLTPWEYAQGSDIYTNTDKLPLTNEYAPDVQWQKDWINQRGAQFNSLANNQVATYAKEHPILDFFGGNDNPQKLASSMKTTAINNLNSLKFLDGKKINGDTYVDANFGAYKPFGHKIVFNVEPGLDTKAHEIGHGTHLAAWQPAQTYIQQVASQDPKFKSWKSPDGDTNYYKSNEEIYSRIWGLRRLWGLKPTDVVTPQMIQQKKQEHYNGDDEIFKYLNDDSVSKLLNGLVSNNTNSNEPVAKYGGNISNFEAGKEYDLHPSHVQELMNQGYNITVL